MTDAVDQFANQAKAYAAFRPSYPTELYDAIAQLAPGQGMALDVATGNGQAARGLAARFQRVVGLDGGLEQLAAADRASAVRFAAAVAEALPVRDASCDVVIVAQALHWFDRPRFFAEVDRILVARGVLAVWLYMLADVDPGVDGVLLEFYDEIVGQYWLEGRKLIDDGYRGIELPFPEVEMPPFTVQADLSLNDYLGYVGTWSAVARFRTETGNDPLPALSDKLRAVWGRPGESRTVRWPVRLRAAVKP